MPPALTIVCCPILQGCPSSPEASVSERDLLASPSPPWWAVPSPRASGNSLQCLDVAKIPLSLPSESSRCVLPLSCPASGSHQCAPVFSTVSEMTFQKVPATGLSYTDARLEHQTRVPLSVFLPATRVFNPQHSLGRFSVTLTHLRWFLTSEKAESWSLRTARRSVCGTASAFMSVCRCWPSSAPPPCAPGSHALISLTCNTPHFQTHPDVQVTTSGSLVGSSVTACAC